MGEVQAAQSSHRFSRGWVVANHPLDTALVLCPVLLEQIVGVCLRRRLGVGVVEEVLDAYEDLLDSDSWLPGLLLVQYGQADGATRVDIRVEERWNEFACPSCQFSISSSNSCFGDVRLTLWRLRRVLWVGSQVAHQHSALPVSWIEQITVRKLHSQFELTTLPNGLLLARYAALPVLEV